MEDADTMVAAAAIELAALGKQVTVIADDTDILFLLIHHFKEEMSDICFSSEKISKTWSIKDIIQQIGPSLKQYILFLHAWLGCDTTSAIYDQGKTSLSKKLISSSKLRELADQMSLYCAEPDDIVFVGRQIFLQMYGGNASDSLGKLR